MGPAAAGEPSTASDSSTLDASEVRVSLREGLVISKSP
jgi:hypothetical protein